MNTYTDVANKETSNKQKVYLYNQTMSTRIAVQRRAGKAKPAGWGANYIDTATSLRLAVASRKLKASLTLAARGSGLLQKCTRGVFTQEKYASVEAIMFQAEQRRGRNANDKRSHRLQCDYQPTKTHKPPTTKHTTTMAVRSAAIHTVGVSTASLILRPRGQ